MASTVCIMNGTVRLHTVTRRDIVMRVADSLICDTPPHFACSPRPAAKCLTFAEGKALVRASATMSSVGQ